MAEIESGESGKESLKRWDFSFEWKPGVSRSEWPMAIVGSRNFSCMTLSIGFDLIQCVCAHDMSNRLA